MSRILDELQRQRRGWIALRLVFGWQGVAAIAFVIGLLLSATLLIHGAIAFALVLFLLLLAIRAHDLGEDDGDRTEFTELWDAWPAAQRKREEKFLDAEIQAAEARAAQAKFLRDRGAAALGKPHTPSEL